MQSKITGLLITVIVLLILNISFMLYQNIQVNQKLDLIEIRMSLKHVNSSESTSIDIEDRLSSVETKLKDIQREVSETNNHVSSIYYKICF